MAIKVFRFEQTTPSANWVVYHALAQMPVFDAMINLPDGSTQSAVPDDVTHTSADSMTVHWTQPRTGYVTVAVGV